MAVNETYWILTLLLDSEGASRPGAHFIIVLMGRSEGAALNRLDSCPVNSPFTGLI